MRQLYNDKFIETENFIEQVKPISLRGKLHRQKEWMLYPFKNVFYKLLLNFLPKDDRKYKYDLTICAIFKNEAIFFKEWIIYHNMLGVQHFYLYNNNSTDEYKLILQPFIDDGLVTLIEWPEIPGQITAYKNWYENYRYESKWCSFLDLDEFICPYKEIDIASWLKRHEKYPVIKMDWLTFGSNGHMVDDSKKLVIENYTSCWSKRRSTGKLFYHTMFDIDTFHRAMMHGFSVKWKLFTIPPFNDAGNIFLGEMLEKSSPHKHTIQVNHYSLKSYEHFKEKVRRGSAAWKKSWKTFEVLWPFEFNNTNSDHMIWRYLLLLKTKMEEFDLRHKE